MRSSLIAIAAALLVVTSFGVASPALAKPKVAVAPMRGDEGGKMSAAVRDMLGGKLAVVSPKDVERAMAKLGLSGELEDGDVDRLRDRLDAAVVVQGKLGRSGKKKTVKLAVSVRGKGTSDFTVQYKSIDSEKFRDAVRDALMKRIGSIRDLEREDEKAKKRLADADDDRPKKKKKGDDDDDDRPKKKKRLADADDDRPKKKKQKKDDDDDGDRPKKKKKVASADDDGPRVKRKRGRGRDEGDEGDEGDEEEGDGEGVREAVARPLPGARVDVGASYAARYLTWTAGGTMRPPKVLTPAPSARIEAELYPLALAGQKGAAAGLGLFGEYDKTVGLSITVPNTMGKTTPINQARYAVGARYRIALGSAAIAGGVAYARRHYLADRSALNDPAQLDTPDVNYAALVPGVGGRAQVAPKVGVFAEARALFVLSAGAIAAAANYGSGTVFGVGGNLGVDVALGKRLGIRVAGEYNQMNLKFKGTGAMSGARMVTAATDRDFGGVVTLAAWY